MMKISNHHSSALESQINESIESCTADWICMLILTILSCLSHNVRACLWTTLRVFVDGQMSLWQALRIFVRITDVPPASYTVTGTQRRDSSTFCSMFWVTDSERVIGDHPIRSISLWQWKSGREGKIRWNVLTDRTWRCHGMNMPLR